MPSLVANPGTAVSGDSLYTVGGYNAAYQNSLRKFDPATNTWTQLANLPTARTEMGVVAYQNKIYAIGGKNALLSTKNECYDIATNTWTTLASMPMALNGCDATELNGLIYILGGSNGVTSTRFFSYNPLTDTYASLDTFDIPRLYARLVTLNGFIYAIGGQKFTTGYIVCNNVDKYDPVTDTWTPVAPLPQPMVKSACAVTDGKIRSVGGSTAAFSYWVALNKHFVYDPVSNIWSADTLVPYPVYNANAESLHDSIFIFGGTTAPQANISNVSVLYCGSVTVPVQQYNVADSEVKILDNSLVHNFTDINYEYKCFTLSGQMVYTGLVKPGINTLPELPESFYLLHLYRYNQKPVILKWVNKK